MNVNWNTLTPKDSLRWCKLLVNLALSLLGLLMQWCSDICKHSDMFWDHCQLYLAGISPVPCSLTYRGFPREPTCLLKPAGSVDERSALEPARPPLPVHALGPWVMTEILPEMQTGKGGGENIARIGGMLHTEVLSKVAYLLYMLICSYLKV